MVSMNFNITEVHMANLAATVLILGYVPKSHTLKMNKRGSIDSFKR